MRYRWFTLVMTLALAACGASTAPATDATLDGPWSSHTLQVGVVLALQWTADSVRGSGTYDVLNGGLGCGGGSLAGSGTVTFAASRSRDTVSGHMAFDNGWTPPYRGMLSGSTLDGEFLTVDAGTCPFPLFRGLVP